MWDLFPVVPIRYSLKFSTSLARENGGVVAFRIRTMRATSTPTTISFPLSANPLRLPIPILRISLTNRRELKSLKLRASFFDYPLASRVIVTNLPYSTSERSLLDNFSNFGQIAEVKLIKDKMTRRSKGFAFIQFTSQDDAMNAIENMDHQNLDGRMIYVEIAKPGKDAFGAYPRTSGPPKQQQHLQVQEEVADCWY